MRTSESSKQDPYSYSEPELIRVRHLDLDLEVCFDNRSLKGTAVLTLNEVFSGELVLDSRDLTIERAEGSLDGQTFRDTGFELRETDPVLGAALTVRLPNPVTHVRIRYSTSPNASGLQWLEPAQTAARTYPFLFTQSEATHARSWIPLQDTPQVRISYRARVRTPRNLTTLMAAWKGPDAGLGGEHQFLMRYAIPSYLIALAVADLDFRELSRRTGVYAERPTIDGAAREFEDLEQILQSAEELLGPYRWGRYDVLVLPPSFPVGGMENPCLTFATPTVLAGDKSLISLVVHELAHSWSSNLVSNATWRDFWLNEGLTVYFERRILEKLYGRHREEMEAALGLQNLERELSKLDSPYQVLHPETNGRDPNRGSSDVPYEKGALFLRSLEETFGRERFDAFLRGYLDHFAFQSVTTAQFVDYLQKNLLDERPDLAVKVPVEEWIHRPGIPNSAPRPASDAFAKVQAKAHQWLHGEITLKKIPMRAWTTHERLYFLRFLPAQMGPEKMKELDEEFHLTDCGNAEVENQWLLMALRNHYKPAYPRVEEFLTSVGRRKFLRSLYLELVKTPEGTQWATKIYEKARPTYHPIARTTVDEILRDGKLIANPRAESQNGDR